MIAHQNNTTKYNILMKDTNKSANPMPLRAYNNLSRSQLVHTYPCILIGGMLKSGSLNRRKGSPIALWMYLTDGVNMMLNCAHAFT